ncbi:hypothetical protein ARGLB_037_01440 [Arthrobacter globiformis NBRC 12137]|uniref:Uncharacterized protein n=1 Tax=Arthrobacter globiformis (strain ATCC 8010 / DSM 20124 / JCM 1332 / NBRC 12137 / NCIMB 8907 / NRRL B-2979 / 168) TaxID=1077972 RepID=H0QK53_ARTG1|nr:hypothetical protein [Arthrobacter globiformis]GAB13293.1 hypothetical protein ARGLB_037_01440 [Arthrobacter globiformis NBRC 12137]
MPTIVVGLPAVVITLLAFSEQVYATLIAAAAEGFFVTMGFCVVALLVRILSKKWHPGPFTLPVVAGAARWIIFEVMNLAWPRGAEELPWTVGWAVPIGLAGIALAGFLVRLPVRADQNVNQDLHAPHEIAEEEDEAQTTKPVFTS